MADNNNANELDKDNCLGLWSSSRYHRQTPNPSLERRAHDFIMRHFLTVSKTQEFLSLTLEEIILILGDDELNAKNEELVWEAALRWISHKKIMRSMYVSDLLKTVRTGLMTESQVTSKLRENLLIKWNKECKPIIDRTLQYLQNNNEINKSGPELPTFARPRIPHEILFAIGGWSNGASTNLIETYDHKADKWEQLIDEADQIGPRAYHGVAVLDHNIYIIGGFNGTDYFHSVLIFDATTGAWKFGLPLNERRCYVSIVVLDNEKIYALGGRNDNLRHRSCERYDKASSQWTMIAPMISRRSDAGAATLNQRIYVCGGYNGEQILNTCETYDTTTDQWTMLSSPMSSRRSGLSCMAYNQEIHVIGGFNGISRMASGEKYDPERKTWNALPNMRLPRSNFGIEVIGGVIICMGGFTGPLGESTNTVEAYDYVSDEWSHVAGMSVKRCAFQASIMSGLPMLNLRKYFNPHESKPTAGQTTTDNDNNKEEPAIEENNN